MRISLVITGLGVGGAENVVIALASQLALKGHYVHLVSIEPLSRQVNLHPEVVLESLQLTKAEGVIRAVGRLRRALDRHAPDIVHAHLYHAVVLARFACLFNRYPLICSTHNGGERSRLRRVVFRMTNGMCRLVTSVSESARQALVANRSVRVDRVISVHNAIDAKAYSFNPGKRIKVRAELGVAEDQILIVSVGRLVVEKDYPNLLLALTKVDLLPRHRVVIAGGGAMLESLQAMTARWGLADRVTFLGPWQDVAGLLSAADVFVLSSMSEGLPTVVGEAMANGRFVVSTDCSGAREFLGDTGIVVARGDADALAAAIRSALLAESAHRTAMGEASRLRVVSQFSVAANTANWLSIYADVIGDLTPEKAGSAS